MRLPRVNWIDFYQSSKHLNYLHYKGFEIAGEALHKNWIPATLKRLKLVGCSATGGVIALKPTPNIESLSLDRNTMFFSVASFDFCNLKSLRIQASLFEVSAQWMHERFPKLERFTLSGHATSISTQLDAEVKNRSKLTHFSYVGCAHCETDDFLDFVLASKSLEWALLMLSESDELKRAVTKVLSRCPKVKQLAFVAQKSPEWDKAFRKLRVRYPCQKLVEKKLYNGVRFLEVEDPEDSDYCYYVLKIDRFPTQK